MFADGPGFGDARVVGPVVGLPVFLQRVEREEDVVCRDGRAVLEPCRRIEMEDDGGPVVGQFDGLGDLWVERERLVGRRMQRKKSSTCRFRRGKATWRFSLQKAHTK